MSARIEKTILRQQEKIAEGNFYEAHQQLRVIATRYVKASQWTTAIDVLYRGALALLQAGQGGSGGDLCLYLVEVLNKAEIEPDNASKSKVFGLLRAFPSGEPTRKRFLTDAIRWTITFGTYSNGDAELHHLAGTLYAEDAEAYEAERHFVLGTKDSPASLAQMEYEWYTQDELHTAPLYAARCILPYLLISNLKYANKAFIVFTTKLGTSSQALGVQDVSSSTVDVRLYPSLPLLNFLSLLLLACERGDPRLFQDLKNRYAQHINAEAAEWHTALEEIAELWFGIRIPKQSNPLMDMMGGLLFGGGGGAQGSKSSTARLGQAPPAVDLD